MLGCAGLLAVWWMLSMIFGGGSPNSQPGQEQPASAYSGEAPTDSGHRRLVIGELSVVSSSFYGCQSRRYYETMNNYYSVGDPEAFTKALVDGLETGQCTYFEPGDEVFLTDLAVSAYLIRVRRRGETVEYWASEFSWPE